MAEGTYEIAIHEKAYFIKLSGALKFGDCAVLDSFLQSVYHRPDCLAMLVDLTDAEEIDSTHVGLLVGLAVHVKERFGHRLPLISPNEHINGSLRKMGLEALCLRIDQAVHTDGDEPAPIIPVCEEERDIAAIMLEAHRTLIELSEDNRAEFQSVVDLLQSEMDSAGKS